jgi:hypothetical protein
VIGSVDACCRRARKLLNAMTDVLLGGDDPRFTATPGERPIIRIFRCTEIAREMEPPCL